VHVDDEDKLMHQISASGQNRNMVIINESGIYALIFGSNLESAKRFKHWITLEVLPRYLVRYGVKSSQKVHILKFSYLKINLVK
jgi:anti-repressor protein